MQGVCVDHMCAGVMGTWCHVMRLLALNEIMSAVDDNLTTVRKNQCTWGKKRAHSRDAQQATPHTDSMPADVDDVIHAPRDPKVPIRIPSAGIPGKIIALERRKVGRLVPLMVPVHGSHHRGPGGADAEVALCLTLQLVACVHHARP